MKYIVFRSGDDWDHAVIFPKSMNHNIMAEKCACFGKPISAGFIKVKEDGTIYATGHSVSLNIKSRPEDTDIIIDAMKSEW